MIRIIYTDVDKDSQNDFFSVLYVIVVVLSLHIVSFWQGL